MSDRPCSPYALDQLIRKVESGQYLDTDHMHRFAEVLWACSDFTMLSVLCGGALSDVDPVITPHIQIMYSGDHMKSKYVGHYIVVYHDGQRLTVYDSMNTHFLTRVQKAFILRMFPDDNLNVTPHFARVQMQPNPYDCGVFAIANATSIALGLDPTQQHYDITRMRPHLAYMLRHGIMTAFPTVSKPQRTWVPLPGPCDLASDEEFPPLPTPRRAMSPLNRATVCQPLSPRRSCKPKSTPLPFLEPPSATSQANCLEHTSTISPSMIIPQPTVTEDSVIAPPETIEIDISPSPHQTNPDVHIATSPTKSPPKRKGGRPKKIKRGRPKKTCESAEERQRKAVKRYSDSNPGVNRKAVKRYAEDNPTVCKRKDSKYKIDNKSSVDECQSQYRSTNRYNIRSKRQIPKSLTKQGPIGEFSGAKLDLIKTYALRYTSLICPNVTKCSHCLAPLFHEEKGRIKWCCGEGDYIVPNIPPLDTEFYDSSDFLRRPRAYNNLFAFSALGTSGGIQYPGRGISFFKIQGRTYHRVFNLDHTATDNPCGMYIDDGEERRMLAENRKLNVSVVTAITDFLIQRNPFIHLLRRLSAEPSDDAHLVFEVTTRRTHGPVLGDAPKSTEVAAIISTDRERFDPRRIAIWKAGNKHPHTIDIYHPLYEALQYPLLYPDGTAGWHKDLEDKKGVKLSQVKYYRRLLLSEPRFSQFGRLSEEWLVDMQCRVEEQRLRYVVDMQSKHASAGMRTAPLHELEGVLQGGERRDGANAIGADETIQGEGGVVAGRIYLPNTFTGGQRYFKTKYMDGMCIVNRLGKPSYFLTMTCNPKWPEIVESTPASCKASASLIARVFHIKLLELLRDIRSGAFFGKKSYLLSVIEFQKRGLPHAHICFKVEEGGPIQNSEIDRIVRADIPSAEEAGGRLRDLVLTHMIHGPCGPPNRTDLPCWDRDTSKCNKFFPKPHTDVTHVDDRGFVHYKRDSANTAVVRHRRCVEVSDTWVVPYNAALLLKYNCHINLEIASTRKVVKYLFKYINKGPDEARVAVVSEKERNNEVESYATKRYIGACDAAWHMLEFSVTNREPTVLQLPVHLEGQHSVMFRPGKEAEAVQKASSKLLLYFNRPPTPEFDKVTYLDFFEQYLIHSNRPKTKAAVIAHPDGVHFITKRQRGEMVARLFWVAPNRGELFYLRLLLNNFACRGYADLKSLGGDGCTTFQAAARHMGLVNDEMEYEGALEEASGFMTGKRLRRFFVLLLVAGARGADLWGVYKRVLSEDLLERFPDNPDRAFMRALIEIDRSLRRHGACLSDHGLPDVTDDSTELGRELVNYSLHALQSFSDDWLPKLNVGQIAVFDHVHALVRGTSCGGSNCLFIDGPAGSGKTLLLNVLASSIRSQKKIVLCTATSGIAALCYEGGVTAHSMFRLPLDISNANAVWGVSGGSQRAELIREAAVIIFDEAPMAHKNIITILDRSLRDLMRRDEPFGAKIVVFSGDFRQIPPVVVGARNPNDVVLSSLRCSPIWHHLKKFHLTEAQRTRGDTTYTDFLLRVGNGSLKPITIGGGNRKEDLVPLEGIPFATNLPALLEFLFPESGMSDPDECAKKALLCATNVTVDDINSRILRRLPGEPVHLLSVNFVDDANADEFYLSDEALASIHAKGVPDHDLLLKPNAVCIITRNLHFDDGLLNGTKVIIVSISQRLVTVRKPGSQQVFSIPRITFQAPVEPRSPLNFCRRQFPLRLSYAMTINKAQGQTIDLVGVDLRSDVFSHGQLYVGLGRVRSADSIKILVQPERVIDGTPYVKNVVYPQLLSTQ